MSKPVNRCFPMLSRGPSKLELLREENKLLGRQNVVLEDTVSDLRDELVRERKAATEVLAIGRGLELCARRSEQMIAFLKWLALADLSRQERLGYLERWEHPRPCANCPKEMAAYLRQFCETCGEHFCPTCWGRHEHVG